MSNQTNNQNQTNGNGTGTPARPSPFSRTPPPFGRPPTAPTPPATGASPLRRPFGANERLMWTIGSLTHAAVKFQLSGLGDPFHRLLGAPLNLEYGNPAKLVEALQQDTAQREQLEAYLNDVWLKYGFKGAALVYAWDTSIAHAFAQPVQPVVAPPAKTDDDDNSEDDELPDWLANQPKPKPAECLRAIDLALVLNVLARTRSMTLAAGTPLALEAGFMSATLVTDDPRLVALARATGCIEEVWS